MEGIRLREYQQEVINKMVWDLGNKGNSLIVVPQGGGKSIIIAKFAEKIGKDILILQPSKELTSQNREKLMRVVSENEIGVYSASFGTKDIKRYTFATIQSAVKHPELFSHFKIVLLDEANLYNPKNFDGMYNKFFRQIGSPKVFGFTGTPYRLDTFYKKHSAWDIESVTTIKMINRYKQRVWDRMLYVSNTQDMLDKGYLTPLKYYTKELVNFEDIPTNKSKSDFDMGAYSKMIDEVEVADIVKRLQSAYKSIIVFCPTIEFADNCSRLVGSSVSISSTTPQKERNRALDSFKLGFTQVVFNVNIFSYGFDHPQLDCIVLVRPTRSLALHAQMLGRGTRLCEGKEFCSVIDMCGNIRSLGKLENIKVVKMRNAMNQMQWNVVSDTNPSGFHLSELYSFKLKPKKTEEEIFS